MSVSWYAMRSKPNKEDFLARQLDAYGVDFYYPRLQVNPINPRSRKNRPYLPNYLFVHVDLDVVNISTLRWMPGASGMVNFDGEPASIPDFIIAAIKRHVDQLNISAHEFIADLQPGDIILVQDGPFAGYEAIFDGRLTGQDRVRVLLNLLQKRQIPLEIEGRKIRRAKRS
jgi:transcriptional antiterminator RfaH